MSSGAGVERYGLRSGEVDLEELIRSKRPEPVRSVAELMTPDVFASDDEVDEFVAAVHEWRESGLA